MIGRIRQGTSNTDHLTPKQAANAVRLDGFEKQEEKTGAKIARHLGLVAWELCVGEELVAPAWQQAISQGLMKPAGHDGHEQLWRLSFAGGRSPEASAAAPEPAAPRAGTRPLVNS